MNIAILGAGCQGLFLAKELCGKHDITIYDKNEKVGGMLTSINMACNKIDKHYRHTFKIDTELIELLDELRIKDRLKWYKSKMGYYTNNGKLYEFGTPISLLRFNELSLVDKFKFGCNILNQQKIESIEEYEEYYAYEYLKFTVGDNVYNKVWKPLLKAKFGDKYDKVRNVMAIC